MNAKWALTWTVVALAALAGGSSAVVLAQGRPLAMLDQLQAGDWELRLRDEPGAPRRLCLRDLRRLIQLRHQRQNCSQIVVLDTPQEVTVQYTCPGRGYGRTQIRRETDVLLQIDSQGIARGLPFAFSAEARRVGACRS